MTQINILEIPDDLYSQIQGMALSQSCSVNEQIVTLLQQALERSPTASPGQGASGYPPGSLDATSDNGRQCRHLERHPGLR